MTRQTVKNGFNRSDYKICEFCGASLDIGEACDCQKTENNTPESPDLPFKTDKAIIIPFKLKIENKGY